MQLVQVVYSFVQLKQGEAQSWQIAPILTWFEGHFGTHTVPTTSRVEPPVHEVQVVCRPAQLRQGAVQSLQTPPIRVWFALHAVMHWEL